MRFWFYDSETGPLKRAAVEVEDTNGNALPVLLFPVRNTGRARARSMLLILPKPLAAGDEIVIRKTEQSFQSMLGLNFQTLGFGPGRSADAAKLSVHFPKRLKPDFYRSADRENETEAKEFAGEQGDQIEVSPQMLRAVGNTVTVVTSVPLPADKSERRRFIKVVYCRIPS